MRNVDDTAQATMLATMEVWVKDVTARLEALEVCTRPVHHHRVAIIGINNIVHTSASLIRELNWWALHAGQDRCDAARALRRGSSGSSRARGGGGGAIRCAGGGRGCIRCAHEGILGAAGGGSGGCGRRGGGGDATP
jgi:hypothetical protein